MAHYSESFRESIIQKMMPPNNVPVGQLAHDTGTSDVTLTVGERKHYLKEYQCLVMVKIQINGILQASWPLSIMSLSCKALDLNH